MIFATGVGGFNTLAEQVIVYHERGPRKVSPFLVPMMMANAGAANVSMRAGWHGPSETVVTACAAGTHALAAAARLVTTGRCDVAIGGGAEASFHPMAVAAFANMTALSTCGVSRPFDARRDGFVMTEGAGALVLEDWDRAVARGAHIYAEVAGAGSTADAHHITAPAPDGAGAVACMEQALVDAGLEPSDIRHINAHGTSTPLNDLAEARAINKVFGEPGPIVTSTKGVTGHGLGAAGAIEAVASVLSIEHRLIPPTYGCEELDPEISLDVVAGRGPPVGARAGPLQLLRVRRPQRLPGLPAPGLTPGAQPVERGPQLAHEGRPPPRRPPPSTSRRTRAEPTTTPSATSQTSRRLLGGGHPDARRRPAGR